MTDDELLDAEVREHIAKRPEVAKTIANKLRPRHRHWLVQALSQAPEFQRLSPLNAMGRTDCEDLVAYGLLRQVDHDEWVLGWDSDLARAVLEEMNSKEQR